MGETGASRFIGFAVLVVVLVSPRDSVVNRAGDRGWEDVLALLGVGICGLV